MITGSGSRRRRAGVGLPDGRRSGPDFTMIYNDGYRPILGDKHPKALGLPFRNVSPEARLHDDPRCPQAWHKHGDQSNAGLLPRKFGHTS